MERRETLNPKTAYSQLYQIERKTAELLRQNHPKELGIIGVDYVNRQRWVKRPPSTLYWAGLRRYGIFNGGMSLNDYLKAVCALKGETYALKSLGNRNDTEDSDDKDAGMAQGVHFFPQLPYRTDWKQNLSLHLTQEEAEFLAGKIKHAAPNSLLTHLLTTHNQDIFKCDSFEALSAVIDDPRLKADCDMAVGFAKFLYVLRAVYNVVASGGKNEEATTAIEQLRDDLARYSDIDIDGIFVRLSVVNGRLHDFLTDSKKAMERGDVEALKTLVTKREKDIKGSARAKTVNVGMVDVNKWIGGKYLDYRLTQAKQLLKEIFDGGANV